MTSTKKKSTPKREDGVTETASVATRLPTGHEGPFPGQKARANRSKTADRKRISIVDVAREAGVSPATVSRVIHEIPVVDLKVRDHVKEVIERLNYRPHFAARFLPKGRTGYLAVATPRGSQHLFSNPYITRVLEGVGQVLDESSMQLILSTTPAQFKLLISAHSVDGILLLGVEMNDDFIDDLEQTDIPVVLIGGFKQNSRFSVFTPDYARAVQLSLEHLHALGHKRVGFICGPPNRYKWRLNQSTFEATTSRLGMGEVGSIVAPDYREETGYACLKKLIDQGLRLPTAYVSTSDILAIGLMKAAQDHNLSVPEDLSVVSYGDIPRASQSQPPLTTVGGEFVHIGADATRTLIDLIEGRIEEPVHTLIEVSLVVRKSTAPAKLD